MTSGAMQKSLRCAMENHKNSISFSEGGKSSLLLRLCEYQGRRLLQIIALLSVHWSPAS